MKTTKQLLKDLEKRSAFWLAWAVVWRWFVIVMCFYAIMFMAGFIYGLTTI